MRPIEVTMQGFGPFADPVTVDLDAVELFALVGPTGSGKSTIIDAICFALYGSIPRYDDRRAVGAVVHALAMEARVSLTFELGGRRYVAARVVRRDKHGKASTKDVRLEAVDGEVLAGTTREMDAAVPRLLGLGFDQFTRAVVLPQGEFARFLHDKPAARQDLLVQLLGLDVYERMMQAARTRAAAASSERARDQERIDALAGATPETIAALDARAASCAQARATWRSRQPDLDERAVAANAADALASTAATRVQALDGLEPPADLEAHSAVVRAAESLRVAAEARVEELAAAVLAADAAVAALGARDALVALGEVRTEAATLTARRVPLDESLVGARDELDEATVALAAAEELTEHLRTASAAHVVREHLSVGDPCPVCEQVVAKIPRGRAPAAWRDAREAADKARARVDTARADQQRVQGRIESIEARQTEIAARLVDAPAPEAVEAQLAQIDEAVRMATQTRTDERTARTASREAKTAFDAAAAAVAEARRAYRAQRDGLTAIGLAPPPETDDIGSDWTSLLAWAETEATTHRRDADGAMAEAATIRRAVDEQLDALAAEAAALEIPLEPEARTVAELLEAAAGAEGMIRSRIEQLTADRAERDALIERVALQAGDAEVAAELARLLDANHFERWLVSEALARLVAGGSARLHELSAGRYSFAFDDSGRDFLVVDHTQGDERRSVRTLSGGETFQASLALALALADELAGFAADRTMRLESVFLDEGFGTLDAETLEAVAATIENLGADDRMVGIVTHVPELAARMPVQFRVTKGARTSTVEKIEA
ncbi:MAG: SMC family ATPase [Acidimicrobiia bacterium]